MKRKPEKATFIERVRPQEPQRDQAARHIEKHRLATGRKVYLPGDAHLIDDIQMLSIAGCCDAFVRRGKSRDYRIQRDERTKAQDRRELRVIERREYRMRPDARRNCCSSNQRQCASNEHPPVRHGILLLVLPSTFATRTRKASFRRVSAGCGHNQLARANTTGRAAIPVPRITERVDVQRGNFSLMFRGPTKSSADSRVRRCAADCCYALLRVATQH